LFFFRRIRDRQVQDRIREITGKMLKRRNGVRGNALEEKQQAELEIREVNYRILCFFSLNSSSS
jgi:repressor of nif and glnA expression